MNPRKLASAFTGDPPNRSTRPPEPLPHPCRIQARCASDTPHFCPWRNDASWLAIFGNLKTFSPPPYPFSAVEDARSLPSRLGYRASQCKSGKCISGGSRVTSGSPRFWPNSEYVASRPKRQRLSPIPPLFTHAVPFQPMLAVNPPTDVSLPRVLPPVPEGWFARDSASPMSIALKRYNNLPSYVAGFLNTYT